MDAVELESAIERIQAEHRTDRLSIVDLIRRMDLMIAAHRAVLARRLEREPLASHMSITMARAFSVVEDAGIACINKSLQQIADAAGYHPEVRSVELSTAARVTCCDAYFYNGTHESDCSEAG